MKKPLGFETTQIFWSFHGLECRHESAFERAVSNALMSAYPLCTHLDSMKLRLSAGATLNWQRRTASADWQGPTEIGKSFSADGRARSPRSDFAAATTFQHGPTDTFWPLSPPICSLLAVRCPEGVWILGGCDEVILAALRLLALACEFRRPAWLWLMSGTARISIRGFRPPNKVFRLLRKLHVPAGAVASSMGTSGRRFSCRLLNSAGVFGHYGRGMVRAQREPQTLRRCCF